MELKCCGSGCGAAIPMAMLTGFANMEVASKSPQAAAPHSTRANATVVRAIHGYQRQGRTRAVCRFEPSCSKYSEQAFERYPFIKATLKTAWRLTRCNNWNHGPTRDPV